MTQSLEDLKKKAREVAVPGHTALGFTFTFTAKDLDTLIEQVYHAAQEEQRQKDASIIRNSGWHTAEKLARLILPLGEVNWYTQKQLDAAIHARTEEVVKIAEGMEVSAYDEKGMFTEEASAYNQALTDLITTLKDTKTPTTEDLSGKE